MPIRSSIPAIVHRPEGSRREIGASPVLDRPLSVLHVIAPAAVGGAESVVRLLAAAQQERGERVSVAAIVHPGEPTPFLDALHDAEIFTHRVCLPPRAYYLERRRLASICAAWRPSVVHTHGYRADVVDALHIRRQGTPIVATVHGFTGGTLRNHAYQWLQRRAYSRFDAVAVVSAPLEQHLAPTIAPHRLHVVPNAYRAESPPLSRAVARAALGIPDDVFLVGWVGRLSREKGADVLIDALAHLAVPDAVHAVILGTGPEERSLRRRALRRHLGARITWAGPVPGAARCFSAFDAFALSSRSEGTPMVVLEAMAAGVPIIATAVGGVPDLLPPGTALLVPPDSSAQLAVAIRSVFVERGAAAARSRAAFARLTTSYSVASWAARYDSVYRQARDGAPGSRR